MQKKYLLILVPFMMSISSCSTMTIDVDYNESISFTGLKNFDWVPGTPVKSNNPKVDSNTLLHDRIRQEIISWLLAHGYTHNKDQKADFLVAYQLIVEDKTKITVINDYYDYPIGWGYYGYGRPYGYGGRSRQHAYEYKEGALIIDIVNPETKKLMWRGSATDEVSASSKPDKKNKQIKEAVDRILSEFPPK